jgi:hypothetical protein
MTMILRSYSYSQSNIFKTLMLQLKNDNLLVTAILRSYSYSQSNIFKMLMLQLKVIRTCFDC